MNNLAIQKNKFSSQSKFSQWFKWNWSEDMDSKIALTRALITWIILLLTYACFQFLWQVVNQANNYQGPVYDLYPSSASNPTISRVSNWSVTITRGCVAVLIGGLITKIGHKKAVIFSFLMIFLSIPFIFTPAMKEAMIKDKISESTASQTSYALFILFRIFLAVGGTAITILQAPIIAKFIVNPKRRNTAIKLGSVPAQVVGIIASLIFINGVVKIGAAGVASQWKMISGIIMGFVGVLFIIYLFMGMHFKLRNNSVNKTQLSEADEEKNTIIWLIKQPRVMIFLMAGMFSLYAGIEPGSGVLSNFWKTTSNNVALTWSANGIPSGGSTVSTVMLIWQMLYSASLFLGIATIGKWSNTKYSAARFSGVMVCLGTVFWAISFGLGAVGLSSTLIAVFVIIFGVLGSSCIFGTQTLTGVIPYRWGFNPRQQTNYAGLSWTSMYIGYSILDIITAYVGTAGVSSNQALISDFVQNNTWVYNTDGTGLFSQTAASLSQQDLSAYYSKISNIMIGTSESSIKEYLTKLNVSDNYYNWNFINSLMSKQSLSESFSKISNQYVPQISIISIAPIISGIIFLFIKNSNNEIKFTFKHFKEHHMDFHNVKRISNKLFGTKFVIKEQEEII